MVSHIVDFSASRKEKSLADGSLWTEKGAWDMAALGKNLKSLTDNGTLKMTTARLPPIS